MRTLTAFAAVALTAAIMTDQAEAGAQKYTHPEFGEITKSHKVIALLPFRVTIDKKNLPKNVTMEMLAASEKEEGMEFQRQFYARFLQRAQEGAYRVECQDVDHTNALLIQAGMQPDNLVGVPRDSIARVLKVDALVSGAVAQAHPTSTGTAMIQTALLGFSGSTQRVDIDVMIHNGSDGKLLWSYDHTDKGGLSNNIEAMVKSLLKKATGNFPYLVKK